MKTIVTHQLETVEEKCDDNSSDDSNKVGLMVDKKELTTFMVGFMEQYMRPTSKIVLKRSSTSDLTLGTAASEAESEIKRKCQKGYDTQLRGAIRDKMYARMKFVNSEQLSLDLAELGLNTGYVKFPIDWKERNFKLHLKKQVYRAYN